MRISLADTASITTCVHRESTNGVLGSWEGNGPASLRRKRHKVCPQAGITEQTFYRRKKKYLGLEIDQVQRLKQLQEENT